MEMINNVRYKAYDLAKMAYSSDVIVGQLIMTDDALMFFAEYKLSSFWASLGLFFAPLVNRFGKQEIEGADELHAQVNEAIVAKNMKLLRELAEGHLSSFLIEKGSVTSKSSVHGKDVYVTSDVNMFTFTLGAASEVKMVKNYLGL